MTEEQESLLKIETIDERTAIKLEILDELYGSDFWHHHIRRLLSDAGIVTRRIQREEAHPVWIAWLTNKSFALDADTRIAARQVRRVLAMGGLKIARDEFSICYRRGDKLHCSFMLDLGKPGVA